MFRSDKPKLKFVRDSTRNFFAKSYMHWRSNHVNGPLNSTCLPRLRINRLAQVYRRTCCTGFGLDPFSPCLFAFCNRQRNKLKILYWEHNGFWLFYRRLEQGIFQWPTGNEQTMSVSSREFHWLLDGLSLSQHQAHLAVSAKTVV